MSLCVCSHVKLHCSWSSTILPSESFTLFNEGFFFFFVQLFFLCGKAKYVKCIKHGWSDLKEKHIYCQTGNLPSKRGGSETDEWRRRFQIRTFSFNFMQRYYAQKSIVDSSSLSHSRSTHGWCCLNPDESLGSEWGQSVLYVTAIIRNAVCS